MFAGIKVLICVELKGVILLDCIAEHFLFIGKHSRPLIDSLMMDWHCMPHIKQVLIIAHLSCQHKCPEGLFLTQSYFMTSEDLYNARVWNTVVI